MNERDEFLKVVKDVAREAGEMLKKNFHKKGEIYYKGDVNLVTDADNQSQKLIYKRLSSLYPGHDFLAEEGLEKARDAEFRWIFDPLDGTTNFAHKFPVFCVSLALEQKGEVICGVVYDPMREEMFWAAKGKGAYLNQERIRVSSIDDLGKSLLATGFPYDIRRSKINNIDHFINFLLCAQAVRRCGSAALDLCYVACGRFDGFWELKLNPWDVAAGALIVKEAEGQASNFNGKEFSIYHPEVLATNGLIHQQMIKVLNFRKRKRHEKK